MSESSTYNSLHRALLQSFMAASTFTFAEVKPVIANLQSAYENRPILPEDIHPSDLISYISTLNAALDPFDYEIRSALPQTRDSGSLQGEDEEEVVYALVNNKSDPETQLATTYSADEVAYVHRLLAAMFDTYNTTEREVMAIKHHQALGLSRAASGGGGGGGRMSMNANGETQQGTATQAATQAATAGASSGLTKEQANKVLKKLVSEGWFVKSDKEFYSLDTRGLIELSGFLRDTFNVEIDPEDMEDGETRPWQRIKFCEGCQSIVTVGQRCTESTCMVRLHDRCVPTFFHGQASKPCPGCKEPWTGTSFVGERAAPRDGGVNRRR